MPVGGNVIFFLQLLDFYTVKVLSPTSWQFKVANESQANQCVPMLFGSSGYSNNVNSIIGALYN